MVYAAVTSRSYHPGCVNALFMDGAVRTIKNEIGMSTWRALGSRNGFDVPNGDEY